VPTLHFHIVPNAKVNQIVGAHGAAIKIKLRATATEGKANAASLNFLADQLEISKHAIVLERGRKSREKLIRIEGLSEGEIRRRLGIQLSTGSGR
jgi:uncharacterized protein (TIGR00251 family)